eukprot:scaffold44032_cov19-Prasinocladus_malaysianus.AAC.1
MDDGNKFCPGTQLVYTYYLTHHKKPCPTTPITSARYDNNTLHSYILSVQDTSKAYTCHGQ